MSVIVNQTRNKVFVDQKNTSVNISHEKTNVKIIMAGVQGPPGIGSTDLLPRVEALENEPHILFNTLPPLP